MTTLTTFAGARQRAETRPKCARLRGALVPAPLRGAAPRHQSGSLLLTPRRWCPTTCGAGEGWRCGCPGGFSTLLAPLLAKLGARFLTGACRGSREASRDAGALVRAVNARDAVVTDYEAEAVVLARPAVHRAEDRARAPRAGQGPRASRDHALARHGVPGLGVAEGLRSVGPDPPVRRRARDDDRHAGEAARGRDRRATGRSRPRRRRPRGCSSATSTRRRPRLVAARDRAGASRICGASRRSVELWRVGHGSTRPAPGYVTKIAPRLREPLGPHPPVRRRPSRASRASSRRSRTASAAPRRSFSGFGKLDKSWL